MGFLNEKHYYSTSGSGKQGLFWEETPARPVRPRAVDKSVDNVDNWEFGEFGSLWGKSRLTPFILPHLVTEVVLSSILLVDILPHQTLPCHVANHVV